MPANGLERTDQPGAPHRVAIVGCGFEWGSTNSNTIPVLTRR
jgi:hypothetical protein